MICAEDVACELCGADPRQHCVTSSGARRARGPHRARWLAADRARDATPAPPRTPRQQAALRLGRTGSPVTVDGVTYPSVAEASRRTGIRAASLWSALALGGRVWRPEPGEPGQDLVRDQARELRAQAQLGGWL